MIRPQPAVTIAGRHCRVTRHVEVKLISIVSRHVDSLTSLVLSSPSLIPTLLIKIVISSGTSMSSLRRSAFHPCAPVSCSN